MSIQTEKSLFHAYDLLKAGTPAKAKTFLEEALSNDLENQEIVFTLRCATFWEDRLSRIMELPSAYEKGENLIANWKQFIAYIGEESMNHEQSMYAVRKGVFTLALEMYQSLLKEPGTAQKNEAYRRLGLCYKKLGDYETALRFFSEANSKIPDSAAVLAEMGDCYALFGEDRTAKVLFREAFFINPQQIDIPLLESELICCLYDQVLQMGFSGPVLLEWIPVYGVLFGVLNIKRGLRAYELAKLKQSINVLENELKEAASEPQMIIPRLINRYFWLIDYFTMVQNDRSEIQEILLKIKLLDSEIYNKYTI